MYVICSSCITFTPTMRLIAVYLLMATMLMASMSVSQARFAIMNKMFCKALDADGNVETEIDCPAGQACTYEPKVQTKIADGKITSTSVYFCQ